MFVCACVGCERLSLNQKRRFTYSRTPPPPQLPIPKILFHPLAILFHPLAILFHPLAILFHPWNVDDVTRAMSKGPRGGGGVLVNVQEGGVFQFFGGRMTSRGQCPRGGGVRAWCSTHPSSDPPPTPGWLATGLHT